MMPPSANRRGSRMPCPQPPLPAPAGGRWGGGWVVPPQTPASPPLSTKRGHLSSPWHSAGGLDGDSLAADTPSHPPFQAQLLHCPESQRRKRTWGGCFPIGRSEPRGLRKGVVSILPKRSLCGRKFRPRRAKRLASFAFGGAAWTEILL